MDIRFFFNIFIYRHGRRFGTSCNGGWQEQIDKAVIHGTQYRQYEEQTHSRRDGRSGANASGG